MKFLSVSPHDKCKAGREILFQESCSGPGDSKIQIESSSPYRYSQLAPLLSPVLLGTVWNSNQHFLISPISTQILPALLARSIYKSNPLCLIDPFLWISAFPLQQLKEGCVEPATWFSMGWLLTTTPGAPFKTTNNSPPAKKNPVINWMDWRKINDIYPSKLGHPNQHKNCASQATKQQSIQE